MTVNLSKNTEESIRAVMRSGHFASPEEVVAEAIRLLQREMSQRQMQTERPLNANPSSPDPIWGLMRNDAELMDEIVAEAYRQRQVESWREFDL